MENYNLKQVEKSLHNRGYMGTSSFGDESWATYFFERDSNTGGTECATVEECQESGECTIDGINPKTWGEQN